MSEVLPGGNTLELYTNLRAGEKGAWLSIGTYIFLSAMKLRYRLFWISDRCIESRWIK